MRLEHAENSNSGASLRATLYRIELVSVVRESEQASGSRTPGLRLSLLGIHAKQLGTEWVAALWQTVLQPSDTVFGRDFRNGTFPGARFIMVQSIQTFASSPWHNSSMAALS